MNSSKLRSANLVTLLILILSYLSLSISLGQWLNPAPSDIRLSFEQTSPAENSQLPQRALDNNMPQLGKTPFWIDGKLMQSFGRYSPYVVRYVLFLLGLSLMLFLFMQFIKPEEEDFKEWALIFLATLAGSFFFLIKFFFWLDYLVAIPLTLFMVILMRKNSSGWLVFLLVMIILYVKISAFFILLTFLGVFGNSELMKKYKMPLAAASLLSITYFFIKWGPAPFADRGHSFINNFSGFSLMGLNLISKPWIIFSFFDKSVQKLVTSIDLILIIKMSCILGAAGWLMLRKIPGTTFRLSCILLGFFSALLLLRDTPTLHDFAAYIGVVELGCLSLFWIVYRQVKRNIRYFFTGAALLIAVIQFYFWNSSFKELDVSVSKASLATKILKATQEGKRQLFLFCSSNVGEYEYFLKDVQIHYSLWEEPLFAREFVNAKPAILLIPKRCQHEAVTELMNLKYAALLNETQARFMETVQIDKNQVYDIYEVR